MAEILRRLADEFGHARLTEVFGPGRSELARIVPELGEGSSHRRDDGRERAHARLFAALQEALRGVAGDRPLLVCVEDLHWADQSTLDVVSYLARTLRDDPIGIMVTVRDDAVRTSDPVRSLLGELARLPHVTRFDLRALRRREVADQVAAIEGSPPEPEQLSRIAERSGGNPFFVEELVASGATRDGGGPVPPMVSEVIAARLAGLPGATREVVATAAIIGQDLSHELLASLTGLTHDDLVRALRSAVDHHVLVAYGDRYRFRHALVREVAEQQLLPAERTELHRRVAEVLTDQPQLGTAGAEQIVAEVARHWHEAGEVERAFASSFDAAEQAQRTAAYGAALAHYERVLALWDAAEPGDRDHIEVLRAAAGCAEDAGELHRGAQHLRKALEVGGADGGEREADLRRQLAGVLSAIDREGALEEAERARDLVGDLGPSAIRARALAVYAQELILDPARAPDAAIAPAREAVAAARAAGEREVEADVLIGLARALGWIGEFDESLAALDQARVVADELGDDLRQVRVARARFVVLFVCARREDEAQSVAAELASWLQSDGHRWLREARHVAEWLGYAYLRAGDLERVEEALDSMADGGLEGIYLALYYHVRGTMYWMRGRLSEASADVQRMRELAAARFQHDQYPLEAQIAAEQGRLADVRELAAQYLAAQVDSSVEAMKTGVLLPLVRSEVDHALASRGGVREEHERSAKQTLSRMRELVDRFPPPPGGAVQLETPSTWVLLAEAELSRLVGPDPDRWRASLDAVDGTYWRTYARLRLAEALLAGDERDAAAEELLAAHSQAQQMGADGLREDIEALARRARLHLPGVRAEAPGDLGLTSREREVLGLVALGCSNVEIGARLFISRKTASVHVSNLLTKTGRDSRADLAAWAVREGIVDLDVS